MLFTCKFMHPRMEEKRVTEQLTSALEYYLTRVVCRANYFLFVYEYRYLCKKVREKDWAKVRKLLWVGRFLDDILPLDCPEFEDDRKEIYPDLLIPEKESKSHSKVVFDELLIRYSKRLKKLSVSVYDKRDHPKYSALAETKKYPAVDSGISEKCKYGIIHNQFRRYRKESSNRGFI